MTLNELIDTLLQAQAAGHGSSIVIMAKDAEEKPDA